MDNGSELETISLWGVLHEGELRRVRSDREGQTASLEVVVPHLSTFYGWPEEAGIRFEFSGVTGLAVNQWIPEPMFGNEDIGSRRWSRREWTDLERSIPPDWIEISEASLAKSEESSRIQLAGFEQRPERSSNVLVEVLVHGARLDLATPDGPCDVERLIQIGDAYWDNLGKKRKR